MTAPSLSRLLNPRSIALVGGVWTDPVAAANRTVGYSGRILRVHPTRPATHDQPYYRTVADLPETPDAAFVAVPKGEVPGVAAALAARETGGFVCFAAGFSETATDEGRALTAELERAAGALPYFGPNCYGFVNLFDRAALWPDQVVGEPLERGVALICQSGTLALTLMFNGRSLPIGYVITVGNQTRLAVEDVIEYLAEDRRVSAFGLYIEGIKDVPRMARAVERARAAGQAIAVVKAGRTAAAARTAHSHTGSLAGADIVFDAFCHQAGIARCDTLGTLCETLKVLHAGGPLPGRRVLVMGASGGDMAMSADVARSLSLEFPAMPAAATAALNEQLGGKVAISNPFDVHTYLWFDPPGMERLFRTTLAAGFDAAAFMLDLPPEAKADSSTFVAIVDAFLRASADSPTRGAILASLPETLPAAIRARCLAQGVIPLQGQREGLEALDLAGGVGTAWRNGGHVELRIPPPAARARTLTECAAKQALSKFGLPVPKWSLVAPEAAAGAATTLGFPVVLKASAANLEHKSDLGGVIVDIGDASAAAAAARRLAHLSGTILVEQMITDGVAEILVGVTVDAQFGQVLVVGAGGVLTELLKDSVTLLPPWTPDAIEQALRRLRAAPLLTGYRGKPAGDVPALVAAVMAVARYAEAHASRLVELDVNPVIVRPVGSGVMAVDALVRLAEEQ
jgi:acetate---CoA ligase (ADP-forming)